MTDKRYNLLVTEFNQLREDLNVVEHSVTRNLINRRMLDIVKLLDLADAASGQEAPAELQEC